MNDNIEKIKQENNELRTEIANDIKLIIDKLNDAIPPEMCDVIDYGEIVNIAKNKIDLLV